MARGKQSYENDTNLLIERLTSFQEKEENFAMCKDFALSNFKYHRFLDVDSKKIQRACKGLSDKFQIHAQGEKAIIFDKLVAKFLESADYGSGDIGKTDTHYALLSLLLCLSDAPINATYEKPPERVLPELAEPFDWGSYLREGIHVYNGPYPESSESSDDEYDLEQGKVRPDVTFGPVTEIQSEHVGPDVHLPRGDLDLSKQASDWLSRNLVVQYWSGPVQVVLNDTSHRASNLSTDWEAYLSNMSPLYVPKEKMLITEHHIMRETLWMLCGAASSVLFRWDGSHYVPSPNAAVTHLTDESLMSLLCHLAEYGSIVRRLYDFVDSVSEGKSLSWRRQDNPTSCVTDRYHDDRSPGICEVTVSQTYQAFAAALSVYLKEMQMSLSKIEKNICEQDGPNTLTRLLQDLLPHLRHLDTLEHIYVSGIVALCQAVSPSQRSAGLLSVMYESLMENHNMGEEHIETVKLLLPLWIKTSKPYLDLIDKWLTQGELVDPHQEFIIQRNIDIKSLDENFWDTAFTLQCQEDVTQEDSGSPGHTRGRPARSRLADWAPKFLLPVLDQVILAGKSVELIQNLGKLGQVVGEHTSLYETFIQSLEKILSSPLIEMDPDTRISVAQSQPLSSMVTSMSSPSTQAMFTDNIAQQMNLRGVKDPLLKVNFANIFNSDVLQVRLLNRKESEIHSRLHALDLHSLTPLQLLLQNCLYPHIRRRYDTVSAVLLRILKEEYHLDDYFSAMRRYYLMESGDIMYDFYTEIFEKLRLKEPWQDLSFLNGTMQEALQSHHQEDMESVVVTVESRTDKKNKNKHPVSALEGLALHYKVPWPVDVVLHSRSIKVYGLVFNFILQIKRVKYSLDGLRFDDLQKVNLLAREDTEEVILGRTEAAARARKTLIHRIQIFRMKLLHFVNSLHNYIMTRILHSTGLEFQADMAESHDLDQVIHVHNAYVTKLHERCLLHHRVALIKDIVTKVHDLSLTLASRWDEGIDSISESEFNDMESEFGRCIHFLSSFLNNIIKRGSFPHLESLAYALLSSNEATKTT